MPLQKAVSAADSAQTKTLLAAASEGKIDTLKALLFPKESFDAADPLGGELLCASLGSSYNDNPEMVKFLLRAGADPNVPDAHGQLALHIAAWYGHLESVKLLLAAKANPGAIDNRGRTALHWVSDGILMATGWDCLREGKSYEVRADAYALLKRTRSAQIAKVLKDAGVPVEVRDKEGWTAGNFAKAQAIGDLSGDQFAEIRKPASGLRFVQGAVVKYGKGSEETRKATVAYFKALAAYLDGGASPVLEDPNPRFLEQVRYGNTYEAKCLLGIGAKVDILNADGQQAIHIAAANAHAEMVDLLLGAGAKIDAPDKEGLQAIHHAARFIGPWFEIPKLFPHLLECGAKVNATDKHGRQPLHWLASATIEERAKAAHTTEGHIKFCEVEAARALVAAGASPDAADETGATPLSMAQKSQRKELVAYFQQVLKKR